MNSFRYLFRASKTVFWMGVVACAMLPQVRAEIFASMTECGRHGFWKATPGDVRREQKKDGSWEYLLYDEKGRLSKQEQPGVDGAITTTLSTYNNLGQLQTQTVSTSPGILRPETPEAALTQLFTQPGENNVLTSGKGTQTTAYSYDELGGLAATTSSFTSRAGETGQPVIKITAQSFVYENNKWFSITEQRTQYVEDNELQTITTGREKHQLNGFEGDVVDCVENFAPPFNRNGVSVNRTTKTTEIQREKKTLVHSTKFPTSTRAQIQKHVNGLLVESISASHDGATLYKYDALGRKAGEKQARHANYSTTSYNAQGQIDSETDAAGNTISKKYYGNGEIGAGQLRQETNPLGHSTYHRYDLLGRETHTWGGAVYPKIQGYDSYGQQNSLTTFREGGTRFDTESFPEDIRGDTTLHVYDEATGLLLKKLYADGRGPFFRYYADGLLRTHTLARRADDGKRLGTTYTYTASGLLKTKRYFRANFVTDFEYDALGNRTAACRINDEGTPDGSTERIQWKKTFEYDPKTKNLLRASERGSVIEYAFDEFGRSTGYLFFKKEVRRTRPKLRFISTTEAKTAVTRVYDDFGNLSKVLGDTIPSNLTALPDDLVTSALRPQTFEYSRLANSDLISTISSPVHFVTNRYEENRDILISKQNKGILGDNAGKVYSQYDYTINAIGRPIKRVRSGMVFDGEGETSFRYNSRGELVESADSQIPSRCKKYEYDLAGNRIFTTTPQRTRRYKTNSLNQYTQIQINDDTPIDISYDADGNLSGDARKLFYSWDIENCLREVYESPDGVKVSRGLYVFDSDGRYDWSETYHFDSYYRDGENIIGNYYSCPWAGEEWVQYLRTYVWELEAGNPLHGDSGAGNLLFSKDSMVGKNPDMKNQYFYCYDENSNVVMLLDEKGIPLVRYDYDTFGLLNKAGATENHSSQFMFNTKLLDPNGFYHYDSRYYDSTTGRYMTRNSTNSFSENPYRPPPPKHPTPR